MVSQTRDIAAARTMLQGRQLTAERKGAKPAKATRENLRAEYAAAFPPSDQVRVASLSDAADAHYAAAGLSVDPEVDVDAARAAYQIRSWSATCWTAAEGP